MRVTRTPSPVATAIWTRAPGMAMQAHGEEIFDVEVQADAEHQEDDAELGELLGDDVARDEPRRERADDDSREQVAHDRREPDPLREVPEDERGREPAGQRVDEVEVVRHDEVLVLVAREGRRVQPRAPSGRVDRRACDEPQRARDPGGLFVDLAHRRGDAGPAVARLHEGAASIARSRCGLGVAQVRLERVGERGGCGLDPAAGALRFELGPRRPARGDHRRQRGERLDHDVAKVLAVGREAKDAARGEEIELGLAVELAGEAQAIGEREPDGEALEGAVVIFVLRRSGEVKLEIEAAIAEDRRGLEQPIEPFDRVDAAERADHRPR